MDNWIEGKANVRNVLCWCLFLAIMPVAVIPVGFKLFQWYRARKFSKILPGKVVLITGASSGLGEALAHVMYRAGCKVILAARRIDELERVRKDLLALDVQPAYAPTVLGLDLSELKEIPAFASKALAIHNQIDILINNGGISVRSDVVSSSIDVDLKVMLVNYFGAVALTKAILPSMIKRQSGHICFISSVQGKFGLPYRSSYSASKHAMQAFADCLRAEVVNKKVEVSCISAGYIRTQLSVNALTASGEKYGKMDNATEEGMDPRQVALQILEAILSNAKDVFICNWQPQVAYLLRVCLPQVFFWIMGKRAGKLEKEMLESMKSDAMLQPKKSN